MVEVFNKGNLRRLAFLEKATNIIETPKLNAVSLFSFTLHGNDIKNEYCKFFNFVKYDGQFYRIIGKQKTKGAIKSIIYSCEHAISTLIDKTMNNSVVIGNLGVYTSDVINFLFNKQLIKYWVLGDCDFRRQFEYTWTDENLLAALFSVPNRFIDKYIFKYDFSSFPWKVHLKFLNETNKPDIYIGAGRNQLQLVNTPDARKICTRLYCYGYGEGINRLTIKDVNNGLEYIQSPQSIIDEYGIHERIFTDRRFENPQSLLERGNALMEELQQPYEQYSISMVDLYDKMKTKDLKIEVGKIVYLEEDKYKTYIVEFTKNHSNPGNSVVVLANKSQDIATTIADLADRQRVEQVYAQGATQIYAQNCQENATPDEGLLFDFYVPSDMRVVNFVKIKIRTSAFRSYSKATESGGGSVTTTQDGGGTSTSTESGGGTYSSTDSDGGVSTSTANGGGAAVTSSSGGNYGSSTNTQTSGFDTGSGGAGDLSHRHTLPSHTHHFSIPNHVHTVNVPSHTHNFTIGNHRHEFVVESHTHGVEIPKHSHRLEIQPHTHAITQGIFTFATSVTKITLKVNGTVKAVLGLNEEIDIVQYLLNDSGKINRGSYYTIELIPDDMAYVKMSLFVQGFIQSFGGATY